MKPMSHKEQTSISIHLTKSYLLLFPFFILMLVVIVALGTFLSNQWMKSSFPSTEHTAEKLIQPIMGAIDVTPVTEHGGSVAAVDIAGNITLLGGTPLFEKQTLTMQEWTDFLAACSDPEASYSYTVAYEETANFWLVVGFPASVRIQFSFAANPMAATFGKSILFFSSLLIALLLLLFVSTLIYARLSAKTFITPLRQLCSMVKRITRGNYHNELPPQNLTGEFLWLKNDIATLSETLAEERSLREQLEQDRKRMLLDISHDLRNPIATVMGYAETLCTDDSLDPQKSHRYAEVIWKNSIRANARLDDLFIYSKLEHPDFQLCLTQNDICEFMREQVSLFFADFETEGIITDFSIPEAEIFLTFDEVLMARVFSNLFTNSIRHNKAGTKMSLSLTDEKSAVQIILSDNGMGMEDAVAKTIFEPFTRGDKARNSETGGSSLGLAIAKKIIDAHGGSIALFTVPNEGCKFVIRLK